jgi:hypothetical protein
MVAPSPRQRLDLALDLRVEEEKLAPLVRGLDALGPVLVDPLLVEVAALRLQSFYTGIERCLVLISRVLNGGTPEGSDWHRRLLERMGQATAERPAVLSAATIEALMELLRFRHLVRHLYSYELKAEPVERLRLEAVVVWCGVRDELHAFQSWLTEPLPPS